MKSVVIVSAGGFGREVVEIFKAQNNITKTWDILGFVDEDKQLHGKILNGYPVLGGLDWLREHNNSNLGCVCAIGTCETRKQVVEKLVAIGVKFHNAIHPSVIMSEFVELGHDVIMASEFHYFSDSIDKNTLVIAVSQSGETADVTQGVRRAKENGATVFSAVNVVGSSLARMSDRVLYLNCGPEIGVAATKSYISQLVIFYLLGFAMVNKLEEGVEKITAISSLIEGNSRDKQESVAGLAHKLKNKNDFYYIARGINFAIAGEGALKLKEIAYVHAEGMPAGELKHGTLALVEKGTPVVAICPCDYTFDETLSNVAETKARGAFVIGVSDQREQNFDEWIKIPSVEEIFYPLVTIIPLQLLAYYLAVSRGFDPDKPRNLAKSVTVK